MPYVMRDSAGKIQRVSSRPVQGGSMLPYNNAEVTAFLKSRGVDPNEIETHLSTLKTSDTDMARTVEDIITLLLKKNLLKINDLPAHMRDKMMLRTRLRTAIEEIYNRASGGSLPN